MPPAVPPLTEDWLGRRAVRHVVLADFAVAAVLAAVTISPNMPRSAVSPWWIVTAVGCFVPLAWRRTHPARAAAATAAATAVLVAGGALTGAGLAAMWLAVYAVAAREPLWRAVSAAAVLEVLGIVTAVRLAPAGVIVPGAVLTTGAAAAAVGIGISQQARRVYLAALEERAARLEYERDQQARLAAAMERAKIAREVHDIVTHSLSVMVALADGAAAASACSPQRAGTVMRQVAATGRQAMGEMRRAVGALRIDDTAADTAAHDTASASGKAEGRPLPGLDNLDDLLAEVRAAGLPVRLTVTGAPRPLSPGAQLAVYRIVQESLTNARRHAPGAAGATVTLRYLEHDIGVEIGNDGPVSGMPPGRVPPGHGITGMRERAAAYGGSVTAGPRTGGGWVVRARLVPQYQQPAAIVALGPM
jgi:signal transduction histidine kinase